jgi:L-histidine N-alpha-methyltransferase
MPNDTGLVASPVRPPLPGVEELALAGLLAPRKTLPAQLFYDEAGCRLFQQITELPEYYLTRTEHALLATVVPAVLRETSPGSVLVEYGASDEAKAMALLRGRDARGEPVFAGYVPVDVASHALQRMRVRLRRSDPDLMVRVIALDFLQPITLPPEFAARPRLGFFPGSTIGNLEPTVAVRFLRQARDTLGDTGHLLVGADCCQDETVLLPAYDDAAGVTADFNRNLLVRLNREAGADFALDAFVHRAVWNKTESRIEMHLVSVCDQAARLGGRTIHFERGETIHTENSYKYVPAAFVALAQQAGWRVRQRWIDPGQRFAVYLLDA